MTPSVWRHTFLGDGIMKHINQYLAPSRVFLLLFVVLAIFACNKNDNSNCQEFTDTGLVITSQTEATALPGMVSVFFKVDDKDGKPVALLTSSNFVIYEKGRNDECPKLVSAAESNSRISPKSQRFNFSTMLVLDFSGSVINSSLTELKAAAKSLVENVMPETSDNAYKMGIWWFDGEDKLHQLIGFTSNRDALNNALEGLTGAISTDPSTDLYGAVIKSSDLITQALDTIVDQNIIGAAS
ncbi:MAG TPA: VWA domain-containing protein, partial [Saprospiraceae bacterium]|nr:VWA domain-containing protein [Saprospiraceae bacterium]